MNYIKAKITNVIRRNNQKCGQYIAIKFDYEDCNDYGQPISNSAFKNFFINHPNQELAKKAKQVLYRMKSYLTTTPQNEDNSCFINQECFITLNITDRYKNVNQVYFIAKELKK